MNKMNTVAEMSTPSTAIRPRLLRLSDVLGACCGSAHVLKDLLTGHEASRQEIIKAIVVDLTRVVLAEHDHEPAALQCRVGKGHVDDITWLAMRVVDATEHGPLPWIWVLNAGIAILGGSCRECSECNKV